MTAPTIYVETSVWSHALAEDAPTLREATLEFLRRARDGAFELFISDVVLMELARSAAPLGRKLRDVVDGLNPVNLELDDDADGLAEQFMAMNAVPQAKIQDAQHVAIAIVNELDMLVSWNYKHLVNVRRRELFGHISAMAGYYKPLHIVTPLEIDDEGQQGP